MKSRVPVAVVMITLNEAHNMDAVLDNIADWAQEVFIIDSYSTDATIDIALKHKAHVVQHAFRGFGDQWNFALGKLPISAPWTMKLDPDERLSPELKLTIQTAIEIGEADALTLRRRLWFMGRPLPIRQDLVRVWRTGRCRFSDVPVNEHPLVEGRVIRVVGDLDHHDSPNLHHWYDKQNRYTTAEAAQILQRLPLSAEPKLFGTALERRMWLKSNFRRIPFRFSFLFLHALFVMGTWRAGRTGIVWAHLRVEVHRMIELKLREMKSLDRPVDVPKSPIGTPDARVKQYD